jgi:hypothetical protein
MKFIEVTTIVNINYPANWMPGDIVSAALMRSAPMTASAFISIDEIACVCGALADCDNTRVQLSIVTLRHGSHRREVVVHEEARSLVARIETVRH